LLGYSLNTNLYYRMFYKDFKYCDFVLINNTEKTLKNLPSGDYYIVITGYEFYRNLLEKDFNAFLKEAQGIEVLEAAGFFPPPIFCFLGVNLGRIF